MDSDDSKSDLELMILSATGGDEGALAQLFEKNRPRLRKMIDFRMSEDLRGRVDPSDVLQEAFLELSKRLPEYRQREKSMPFFVWLRLITMERLQILHRRHVGAKMRDARRDVSLHGVQYDSGTGSLNAINLAQQLTSADFRLIREEEIAEVNRAIEQMDPTDREIISMRIFEELSNLEVATILDLKPSTASRRFVRAIESLRKMIDSLT